MREIPTSFKIPKDYQKLFLWKCAGIEVRIRVRGGKLLYSDNGHSTGGAEDSLTLDWIQDSIESVRGEVGA